MEFLLTECITHILGVMIDDKLNWKEHIKMIQSKISKTTAIIYNSHSSVTRVTCLLTFFF